MKIASPPWPTPYSPKEENFFVELLLNKMNVEFEPKTVPVKVDPKSKPASCFYNVNEKINRDGGKIRYGWVVWQHSHIIEAEHHAVWEDHDGNLVDITPQKEDCQTIMFIPDDKALYDGKMAMPNIRLNITVNRLIDDYIYYSETVDKLYGMGTRLEEQQISLPYQIVQVIQMLEQVKQTLLTFYSSGNNSTSQCFCHSKKAYAKCHGFNVQESMKEIEKKSRELIQS